MRGRYKKLIQNRLIWQNAIKELEGKINIRKYAKEYYDWLRNLQ